MFWSEQEAITPGLFANLVDRDLDQALALGDRHREELALLAADEHSVDAELVDPMAQIPAKTSLVDRQVVGEWYQRGRPDALHVSARVLLGLLSGKKLQFSSLRYAVTYTKKRWRVDGRFGERLEAAGFSNALAPT